VTGGDLLENKGDGIFLDTTISKDEAKAAWLVICSKTVQGEDIGKCEKDDY
jgi:hypothetical protein